jgi:hypothetical protein
MPSSHWNRHVANYRALHPEKSFKEVMKCASASYRAKTTTPVNPRLTITYRGTEETVFDNNYESPFQKSFSIKLVDTQSGSVKFKNVADISPETKKVKWYLTNIESVDVANKEIVDEILDIDASHRDVSRQIMVPLKVQGTDIAFSVISVRKWRACTAFHVLQISSKQSRLLTYLSTEVKHGGGSFATSCEHAFRSLKEVSDKALEAYEAARENATKVMTALSNQPKLSL